MLAWKMHYCGNICLDGDIEVGFHNSVLNQLVSSGLKLNYEIYGTKRLCIIISMTRGETSNGEEQNTSN